MSNVEKIITFFILFQFVARLLRGVFKSAGYDDIVSDTEAHQEQSSDYDEAYINAWVSEQDIELSIENLKQIKEEIDASLMNLNTIYFNHQTLHHEILNRVKQATQAQLKDVSNQILEYCTTQEFTKKIIRDVYAESKLLQKNTKELNYYIKTTKKYTKDIRLAKALVEYCLRPCYDLAYAEGLAINTKYIITDLNQEYWPLVHQEHLMVCPLSLGEIDDVEQWPLLVQQVVYCLDDLYPAWARERKQMLNGPSFVMLPQVSRRTLQWPIHQSLGIWSDVLWADMFMLFRWGHQSADLLLQRMLEEYDDLSELTAIKPDRHDPTHMQNHPPVMIRLHVLASLMLSMGYLQESHVFSQKVQQHLGDELQVYTSHYQWINFPIDAVRSEINDWVTSFHQKKWKSWSYRCLSDIPYFATSIADWKHIKTLAEQWIQKKEFSNPHLHFPTLFYLATNYPGRAASLQQWVLQHTHSAPISSPIKESPENSHDDIIAALVLSDLLLKRPAQRPTQRSI